MLFSNCYRIDCIAIRSSNEFLMLAGTIHEVEIDTFLSRNAKDTSFYLKVSHYNEQNHNPFKIVVSNLYKDTKTFTFIIPIYAVQTVIVKKGDILGHVTIQSINQLAKSTNKMLANLTSTVQYPYTKGRNILSTNIKKDNFSSASSTSSETVTNCSLCKATDTLQRVIILLESCRIGKMYYVLFC